MKSSREQEILGFWLGDISEGWPSEDRNQMWWFGGKEVDGRIAAEFTELIHRAKNFELDDWKQTPDGRLALIILIDQFSRNIFRKSKEAFESDEYALDLCLEGIALGQDRELALIKRVFFYMPLMHSEELKMHEKSVSLYQQLLKETDPGHYEHGERYLNAAKMHRDIVEQFGRYPHRNEILGRTSTNKELEYLKDAELFGQG